MAVKPLEDLTDGELVMLAMALLMSDLAGRTAKHAPAIGQKIERVAVECRTRAKLNTT